MKTNDKKTAKKRKGETSTNDITSVLAERPKLIEEINPDINLDETNDFDLTPEKKPALSSMQHNLRDLDKRLAITVPVGNFVQQFDKLKIAIDLRFWEAIGFEFDLEASNMFRCVSPEKPDTWADERKRIKKHDEELMEKYESSYLVSEQSPITVPEFEELDEFLETDSEEEFEETEEEKETLKKSSHRLNNRHFSNCKIEYTSRTANRTRGLNNVYIKNDHLFICVTGKFMGTSESLGYITRDNIIEVLEKVQRLAGFRFNAESFLSRAIVYICHLCIDLITTDKPKDIDALSCLFPLGTDQHAIRKYGRHGLQLKSKAKNAGSSLVFYDKLVEVKCRLQPLLNKINLENPENPITMEQLIARYNYPKNLDSILRVELQIYKLHDMRILLDIPEKEPRKVYLSDVLNSTATPILTRFEVFGATEQILRDKIWGYIKNTERTQTEIRTYRELKDRLAEERIALLLIDNRHDIPKLKSYLKVEYGIDNEALINNLTTHIKNDLLNFLLYKKAKAIKRVLNILEKVHAYYGRGADNE